ncbi:MAG: flippase [Bacteroidales bacterium]|nr:flippase [Bacteroidales bacterium]
MAASVKTNYVFNLLNSVTQVLLPVVTFPYASRILLPEGIGHVNSFASIINVIVLLTSLGIPLYAVREVAKVRDDSSKRNKLVFELLSLNFITTFIGYVAVLILCFLIPQINKDIPLFLLLSLSILFTTIGCEWFYQAVEDFKYIALRGIIVRLLSIVFLFLFVKTREDIVWYAAFTVFGVMGSNVFNFFRLRKYLSVRDLQLSKLNPLRHIPGVTKTFAFNIITSIYVQLNTVFLGFFSSDTSAGYYTASMKLNLTAITVSYSLSTVMLPHLSNLIGTENKAKFKEMAQKSYDFSFALALPMAVGLIFVSPEAMVLLSGKDFIPSILVSQIMSFTIFFIALSNVLGIQLLFPLGYMNTVVKSVSIGCLIDLLLCLILIPKFAHNGASLAYLLAELGVMVSLFILGTKHLPIHYFKKYHLLYVFAALMMAVVLFFERFIDVNYIVKLFILVFSGVAVYVSILLLIKNPLSVRLKEIVSDKFKR